MRARWVIGCVILAASVVAEVRSQEQEKANSERPTIRAADSNAAEVPKGYQVEVAVDRLMYPSSIEFDDAGTMFIAECATCWETLLNRPAF